VRAPQCRGNNQLRLDRSRDPGHYSGKLSQRDGEFMSPETEDEFVFGDERPFASCHASTVLKLADGVVLCSWFGGPYEGHDDVAIWLGRRSAGGTWVTLGKVADEAGNPHWNPVLALSPAGHLNLFYKVGSNCRDWRTRVITSRDGGLSWSDPREFGSIDGFPAGPVKDKPIVLSDGTWLAPTSRETETEWDAAVTISRDDGSRWDLGGPVHLAHAGFEGKGVIQPTLWESAPDRVHMLLRSTAGRIYRADSPDGGRTWSSAYATDLYNNNSGIDLARLGDGTLALVHNPVQGNWAKRTPLVISVSRDNGSTWRQEVVLEDEEPELDEEKVKLDRAHRPNEFSYPAVIVDGTALLVTYTWKRERIRFRRVRL